MHKLINYNYLRKFFLFFLFSALIKYNIFAQTYHDCTATEDFNEFLDNKESIEDTIESMEFEFSKSLSKFDKCIDQDYSQSNTNNSINSMENSELGKNEAEELAEKMEQEGKNEAEELTEKMEQTQRSNSEKLEKGNVNNELTAQKNDDIFFENKTISDKQIVDSKASSDLSGTETNNEIEERSFITKNSISNNAGYNEDISEEISEERGINGVKSIANSELSGTEPLDKSAEELSRFEEDTDKSDLDYSEDTKEVVLNEEGANSQLPKDITEDDNDSVLEKQIKLAAMNEKDPEKKKRLWNEYRKYKGLPQKD